MRRFVFWGSFVAVGALIVLVPALGATATGAAKQHSAAKKWHAAARGGLDCNGFSPVQRTFRQMWCAEIAANDPNGFVDNGHYVGHDEADIGFFSKQHGSSSNMTYRTVLPVDPSAPPSRDIGGTTHDFQLTPARWFGLVMCDNQSYPEGTKVCRPNSDSNIQVPPRKDHAGSAYLELQLYPPGWAPQISCDQVHWCAAVNIFSLQAQYGALHGPGSPPDAKTNPNCTEPGNFAFLTRSGIPHGPPGPDQQNNDTFTTTSDTLMMNTGDSLKVSMRDTKAGFVTEITDLTTHQTGFMVTSESNGFRHILWDPVNFTCKGAPYAFHPMYDTAAPPRANGQPTAWATWSAHTDNVAYSVETGHFQRPDSSTDPNHDEDNPCFTGPIIPGCIAGAGDVDFDGYPYHAVWPNGSPNFPTPNYISSPRTGNGGGTYPIVRFETDLPRIEEAITNGGLTCDHHTGQGCTNPPPGAFYPWYHLLPLPGGGSCAWGLTNDMPNQVSNFGGEVAGWGPLELTNYGFDKRYHNFARRIDNPCP